jgi:DNA-binding PucR family transcriptional regulator
MTEGAAMRGTPLDQLLEGIDGALVELPVVPAGGQPAVVGVAILDPDDELGDHHDELVLVIGVRGRASLPFLRAAARSGAVAVAVKPGPSGSVGELAAAAAEAGVALLAVRPQVRWDQLGALLRERLDAAELVADRSPDTSGTPGDDLFALAEATALVTGGIVDIEDHGNRVLAYSRSDDAVDELRRLSILGWQGPESYMTMLRDWGVLDRLRDGERVVRVDARPELGIRARLAVGVRAGQRYLGTIWVQQRFSPAVVPFAERAEEALVGAARLAAAEILRRRTGVGPVSSETQLTELLTGQANTDLAAGRLGLDPAAAVLVVGFGGPVELDAPARALHADQVRGVVSVYATAYHRSALVGAVEGRVYAVLSGVPRGRVEPALMSWVRDAAAVARDRTGQPWRAGVGSPVTALAELPDARAEADRVLDALAGPASVRGSGVSGPSVATISELRAEMLLGEVHEVLGVHPELRHPGVAALVEHDEQRGGALVTSLLAYLDALGDVRSAAASLHVHPNTLRHRLRRARAVSQLALDDPTERLSCHLQLVLVGRESRSPRRPARR